MTKFDIELVGKIGSMALINKEYNDLNYNIIARISRELQPGYIWVTSGATEIGRLDFIKRNGYELDSSLDSSKADYSAQGQAILMSKYREFVSARYSVRQFLIEHRHFNDELRREYLKDSLLRCPAQNAIPIVNYNDPLASDEISKLEVSELRSKKNKVVECLDNDETASQIACLVKPKTLLILTSTKGIYRNIDDETSLIPAIEGANIDEVLESLNEIQKLCHGASRKGAQGAKAKLEYIKDPIRNGTQVIIASPKYYINDIISGQAPRTIIRVR